MGRQVITAAEVQLAAPGRLLVAEDAIVTPLARDTAADLGVSIERSTGIAVATEKPEQAGEDALMTKVRALVTAMLGAGGGGLTAPTSGPPRPPVKVVDQHRHLPQPFPYPGPPPGMKVATVDVVTGDDGSPMAAGYMTITQGSFPWTFTYDEVQIVLEGELHLGDDGGGRIARAGDVCYVPKGSQITFGTPTWARFVYVTFPADWDSGVS